MDINWVARKDVINKIYLKPLHYLWKSIPVNGAVDKAVAALEEGRNVGIFPEGTRTHDGRMKDGDTGVAVMALKTGKTIVPVCLKGSYEAFGRDKLFPRPHQLIVRIGKPFSFEKIDKEEIEESILEEKKNQIMDRLKELLEG
jgi:1-acyl-sn-glycerol-3-phosphate acyltransferase